MDENRDGDVMRNFIAIALITFLFVAWFTWFSPPPKKPVAPPAGTPTQTAQNEQPAEKPAEPLPVAESSSILPPVPVVTDPADDEVVIADEELKLVFTRIGGRLKEANVITNQNTREVVQLVPTSTAPDTEAVYPLGLTFTDPEIGDGLNYRRFEADMGADGRSVTFSLTLPGKGIIRKYFSLTEHYHVLNARVDYENLESQPVLLGMDVTPAYYLTWEPNVASGDEKSGVPQAISWYKDGKVSDQPTAKLPAPGEVQPPEVVASPEWAAIKSSYFVVAVRPEYEGANAYIQGSPKNFELALSVPRFEVPAQATQSQDFDLYIGPSEQNALAAAWPTLGQVRRFFSPSWELMDKFAKLLLGILNWFHNHIYANYGVAIIFLTVLVRMAIYPLTLKSMKSMKKMQLLGPEMEAIKTQYAENPQEMNKKMMELYKERGVNPLGGCMPMLLQMPIFIALWRMLWSAYELRGAPFMLWITDLSQPDRLLHMPWMASVPFFGHSLIYLNLIPILGALAMVLNSKLTTAGPSQNPQQKMMMTFMPVMFAFFTYNMAAGLNLYILTGTVLGIIQQKFLTQVDEKELEKKKTTVGKRQHFYTAAKARQRQAAREAKKARKP